MRRISIALVHYPVLDREGETVTTAITNLDLHDMARSSRTYGVDRLFIVHPVEAQRALAERIREHWVSGSGKKRIPDRATALDVLAIVPSMADVFQAMAPAEGRRGVELWTTAASARGLSVATFGEARQALEGEGPPVLIAFGTGWGLARELVEDADTRIEPIRARADTGFNHLSVRAACAISLDRLLGR
ncbi:MAG: RNA methyltransferase [Polyangiaceae bacterium]|nr:RNA methyltransferase [Polyangiaceae bacterium]